MNRARFFQLLIGAPIAAMLMMKRPKQKDLTIESLQEAVTEFKMWETQYMNDPNRLIIT